MSYASVNIHGQVTLPAESRKKHGIKPGTILRVVDEGEEIVLRKAAVIEENVLKELQALAAKKNVTKAGLVKIVREMRGKMHSEEYGK